MQRINSKKKGNKGERELVKILNEKFISLEKKFERNGYGSGAVVGKTNKVGKENLDLITKRMLVGDVICPNDFIFHLECKLRKDFSYFEIFSPKSEFWNWINQAKEDSKFAELKYYILYIHINYHEPFIVSNKIDLSKFVKEYIIFNNSNEKLIFFNLTELGNIENSEFFEAQ